jgi:dienelactone hydrolase
LAGRPRVADRGIAAFVLKYRLKETPVDDKAFIEFTGKMMEQMARSAKEGKAPPIQEPRATEDALAALKLVRSRAGEWGIDPSRVGMMGFSAGAMTTLNAGLTKDAADRPAFIAPIYGPMLPLDVPADAPPMFRPSRSTTNCSAARAASPGAGTPRVDRR